MISEKGRIIKSWYLHYVQKLNKLYWRIISSFTHNKLVNVLLEQVGLFHDNHRSTNSIEVGEVKFIWPAADWEGCLDFYVSK